MYLKQRRKDDCAPVAIMNLLEYFFIDVNYKKDIKWILPFLPKRISETTPEHLVKCINSLGLETKLFYTQKVDKLIKRIYLGPYIVGFNWYGLSDRNGHYSTIVNITTDTVCLVNLFSDSETCKNISLRGFKRYYIYKRFPFIQVKDPIDPSKYRELKERVLLNRLKHL